MCLFATVAAEIEAVGVRYLRCMGWLLVTLLFLFWGARSSQGSKMHTRHHRLLMMIDTAHNNNNNNDTTWRMYISAMRQGCHSLDRPTSISVSLPSKSFSLSKGVGERLLWDDLDFIEERI